MTYAINLALLVLGTAGALTAFGGETWRKTNEPLRRRITRRGWLALCCMLIALALGIIKEMLSNAASAVAETQRGELQQKLSATTNELQDARKTLTRVEENLDRTTTELRNTRKKLAAVEPNLLEAMLVATRGLRRESDFTTVNVSGGPIRLLSGRSGEPLALYGGDQVDYHVFCNSSTGRTAGFPFERQTRGAFELMVGGTTYRLQDHGRQMIIGPIGQAMPAILSNPNGLRGCILKLLVESADRTREASQLEPVLRMIRDARSDPANR